MGDSEKVTTASSGRGRTKKRIRGSGAAKIVEQVKRKFAEGNFYEGEQMLKSVYLRMMSAHKLREAAEVLSQGIRTLFEHHQYNAGMQLLDYLLKPYKDDEQSKRDMDASVSGDSSELSKKVTKMRLKKDGKLMVELYKLIDFQHTDTHDKHAMTTSMDDSSISGMSAVSESSESMRAEIVLRNKFINSVTQTRLVPKPSVIFTELLTAHALWQASVGDFYHCSQSLIAGESDISIQIDVFHWWINQYESMTDEDSDLILRKERPLIRLRCILEYLSLGRVSEAQSFMEGTQPSSDDGITTEQRKHALDNFGELIIEAIQRKSLPLYKTLGQTYGRILDASDPQLITHFQNAGFACLGIPRPAKKAGGGGMLGSLLSMLGK